jgi:hypothetical protein
MIASRRNLGTSSRASSIRLPTSSLAWIDSPVAAGPATQNAQLLEPEAREPSRS